MALNEGGGVSAIYLSVSNGKLVRQFKTEADIEGLVSRVNKKGNTVWEKHYQSVEGVITGIEKKESDFGVDWKLTLTDDGERYIISMPYSSRYTNAFFKVIKNIDLKKAIVFNPWQMQDKNNPTKTVSGVSVKQDGKKIEPYFTKENPNGLPQMVKMTVKEKGKNVDKWDDTDLMNFFEDMIEKDIKPLLSKPVAASAKVYSNEDVEDEEPPF